MSKCDKKCDNMQSSTIQVIAPTAPEVKILNRGDLLGAINCLLPELQLKNIKQKPNFSLFSYSLHELTRIFESGRKYRTKIFKDVKCSIVHQSKRSLHTDSSRIDLKHKTNALAYSSPRNKKAQTKRNTYPTKPSMQNDTVEFQSSYTDFVAKYLASNFPDRFVDFKNIECTIQQLYHLYRQMSKKNKIGPFNPNLPVLNISQCGSKDILKMKSSTNNKYIRNKKKSGSHLKIKILKTPNEVKGKESTRKEHMKKRRSDSQLLVQMNLNNDRLTDDSVDENSKSIGRNIDDLLSADTFSPRYKDKHASDVYMIFRKSLNDSGSTTADDAVDMHFNLLEIQANQQCEL